MEWNLEIEDMKSFKVKHYVIQKKCFCIGREIDNELTLPNNYISRKHIQFSYEDGKYYIEDKKSSNGSFLYVPDKWQKLTAKKSIKPPAYIKLADAFRIFIYSDDSTTIMEKDDTLSSETDSDLSLYSSLDIESLKEKESLLVLDMVGSSQLSCEDEKMAFFLKKRVEMMSRLIIFKHGITFFKLTGDGFVGTFQKPEDALACSLKIMKMIEEKNKDPQYPPVYVRIGLHSGEIYRTKSSTRDIYGNNVNIAFRIEGLKKESFKDLKGSFPLKNRILCSEVFRNHIKEGNGKSRSQFRECGIANLKGIKEKTKIYRVVVPKDLK